MSALCVRVLEREEGRMVTLRRLCVGSWGLSADSLTEEAPSKFGRPQEI